MKILCLHPDQMRGEDLIKPDAFIEDWRYHSLTFPAACYRRLSAAAVIQEMIACNRRCYSLPGVMRRVWSSLWQRREPLINFVTNLSTRDNRRAECEADADFPKRFLAASPLPTSSHELRPRTLGEMNRSPRQDALSSRGGLRGMKE